MFRTWWRKAIGRGPSPAGRPGKGPAPRLEYLEGRLLLDGGWGGYAHDAQHTALSTVASQPPGIVRWQTPVDLNPQYTGGDLFIHYGSPLVTPGNTVLVPVKTGAYGGFRVEAHNGGDGSLLWSQATDYLLPTHDWTPSFSPTLTPSTRLYYAGAGGTVYAIDGPDSAGTPTPTHLAFYGIGNYDPGTFDSHVFVDTPITADGAGDIYFGFQVQGSGPLGLRSGIARIDASGQGTWVAASDAARDSNITEVSLNNAPALSNDGSVLYIAVSDGNSGYLVALNSTTLQPVGRTRLIDPRSGADARVADDSTASATVGPDGDVYFGVLENPYASSKGWLLHFSGDLSQQRTPPGGFGWDDTVSVVPSSIVPRYRGSSTYLLMTKYNNYAGSGGDGVNKIAILDPHDTEVDPRTGVTVMREVMTLTGQTRDPDFPTLPNAVREWCINTAAVDPFTHSILANSEDGQLYRWDLDTGNARVLPLTTATGEAYTPTVIGADGTAYAVNRSTLFAVKRLAPAVIASTPAGVNFGTVSSARVTFDEPIDAGTFTLGQVVRFTRTAGTTVTDLSSALLGVAPVSGSGGRAFDIAFAAQSALGDYQLVIGPDILDLAGNPMDQNGNGVLGEVAGDQYTAHFVLQGLQVVSSTPAGTGHLPGELIQSATVAFNEAVDPATFTPDKVTSFTGPDGDHTVLSVAPVAGSGNTAFTLGFDAPLTAAGTYTLEVGPDIRDTAGNPMDQDGDGVPGEVPGDQYVLTFGIQGLRVLSAAANSDLPGQATSLHIAFNEPVDPSTFTPNSLVRFDGPDGSHAFADVVPVAGTNDTEFDALFDAPLTAAGSYTVVLDAFIADAFGNYLGDNYTTPFDVTTPRVAGSSPSGAAAAGVDHVRFTFDRAMDPGSFTAGAFSLTDPNGVTVPVTGVVDVAGSGDTQFDFTFAAQGPAGDYAYLLPAGAAQDAYGNPLPADSGGQFSLPAFRVAFATPNNQAPVGTDHVRLTFDRAVDPATVGTGPFQLTGPGGATLPVTGVAVVAGSGNTQFDVGFAPLTTTGNYSLSASGLSDGYGNALVPFNDPFGVVTGYAASAAPFQDLELLGQPGTQALTFSGGSQYADDDFGSIDLGSNTFNFYGVSYTGANSLFVSSNGLITFGSGNGAYLNTNLSPGSGPTQPLIAPLWSDWVKDDDGTGPMILSKVQGGQLLVEWNRIRHVPVSLPVTFQVILDLNTTGPGAIALNYVNLNTGSSTSTDGQNSTVGVRAGATSDPSLVSFNAANPLVGGGKAIRLSSS